MFKISIKQLFEKYISRNSIQIWIITLNIIISDERHSLLDTDPHKAPHSNTRLGITNIPRALFPLGKWTCLHSYILSTCTFKFTVNLSDMFDVYANSHRRMFRDYKLFLKFKCKDEHRTKRADSATQNP